MSFIIADRDLTRDNHTTLITETDAQKQSPPEHPNVPTEPERPPINDYLPGSDCSAKSSKTNHNITICCDYGKAAKTGISFASGGAILGATVAGFTGGIVGALAAMVTGFVIRCETHHRHNH